MKLYEILNEKYLGKKFKLIGDSVQDEWIREVVVNEEGKYRYKIDCNEIVFLNEDNLLRNVKLIKSEEELYQEFIKDDIEILKGIKKIIVSPNYNDLKYFREKDNVIYVEVDGESIGLSFEDFDLIVNYIEKLKEFKK